MDSLVADLDEGFLLNHYVLFVPGGKYVDWMVQISVFDRVMMWKNCMVVFLSLLRWKPLVKMKLVADLSLGIKV